MNNYPITAETVTNEIIKTYPKTVSVFAKYGADSCCGGMNTIQRISEVHKIDLEILLSELNAVAKSE